MKDNSCFTCTCSNTENQQVEENCGDSDDSVPVKSDSHFCTCCRPHNNNKMPATTTTDDESVSTVVMRMENIKANENDLTNNNVANLCQEFKDDIPIYDDMKCDIICTAEYPDTDLGKLLKEFTAEYQQEMRSIQDAEQSGSKETEALQLLKCKSQVLKSWINDLQQQNVHLVNDLQYTIEKEEQAEVFQKRYDELMREHLAFVDKYTSMSNILTSVTNERDDLRNLICRMSEKRCEVLDKTERAEHSSKENEEMKAEKHAEKMHASNAKRDSDAVLNEQKRLVLQLKAEVVRLSTILKHQQDLNEEFKKSVFNTQTMHAELTHKTNASEIKASEENLKRILAQRDEDIQTMFKDLREIKSQVCVMFKDRNASVSDTCKNEVNDRLAKILGSIQHDTGCTRDAVNNVQKKQEELVTISQIQAYEKKYEDSLALLSTNKELFQSFQQQLLNSLNDKIDKLEEKLVNCTDESLRLKTCETVADSFLFTSALQSSLIKHGATANSTNEMDWLQSVAIKENRIKESENSKMGIELLCNFQNKSCKEQENGGVQMISDDCKEVKASAKIFRKDNMEKESGENPIPKINIKELVDKISERKEQAQTPKMPTVEKCVIQGTPVLENDLKVKVDIKEAIEQLNKERIVNAKTEKKNLPITSETKKPAACKVSSSKTPSTLKSRIPVSTSKLKLSTGKCTADSILSQQSTLKNLMKITVKGSKQLLKDNPRTSFSLIAGHSRKHSIDQTKTTSKIVKADCKTINTSGIPKITIDKSKNNQRCPPIRLNQSLNPTWRPKVPTAPKISQATGKVETTIKKCDPETLLKTLPCQSTKTCVENWIQSTSKLDITTGRSVNMSKSQDSFSTSRSNHSKSSRKSLSRSKRRQNKSTCVTENTVVPMGDERDHSIATNVTKKPFNRKISNASYTVQPQFYNSFR